MPTSFGRGEHAAHGARAPGRQKGSSPPPTEPAARAQAASHPPKACGASPSHRSARRRCPPPAPPAARAPACARTDPRTDP
eukprot:3439426-Prymnesium_polylepis.1